MTKDYRLFRGLTHNFFFSVGEKVLVGSLAKSRVLNNFLIKRNISFVQSKHKNAENSNVQKECQSIMSDLDECDNKFSNILLLQERIKVLENDIEKYINQIEESKEKYIRSLAENENLRQRHKKDVESAKTYAITNFAKGLLEVADSLSKALSSIDVDKIDKNSQLASIYNGISITSLTLNKVFEANGVFKFNSLGKQFNPKEHEAIFEVLDQSKPKGLICEELQSGYKIKDRILRAAKVATIKNQ
ncbi:co-chaperone GrpE [Cryptosporidium ryanae]|uniref:co-chaperone GrpE n=1 Tax=Cryptosporidium ryanae TaxID=515981 RepID=UPI00351A6235|nr:co-chaperone GrpE [Cryptosporidium ryanae]